MSEDEPVDDADAGEPVDDAEAAESVDDAEAAESVDDAEAAEPVDDAAGAEPAAAPDAEVAPDDAPVGDVAADAGAPAGEPASREGWHEDSTYVESQVIMTTVRIVAPFAFTYGLFLTFHGGGSPGGGFQGGAIVGATILMIAFAFGIEPTRDWLANRVVVGLGAAGVVAFALIGLVPIAYGGRFLEHRVFEADLGIYHGAAYALEGVEILGIAPIVAGVVVGLFFAIAAGFVGGRTGWHPVETASGSGSNAAEAAGGDERGEDA